MAYYQAPEGYELDHASGMYYMQQGYSADSYGNNVPVVSWFNPNTGEFIQNSELPAYFAQNCQGVPMQQGYMDQGMPMQQGYMPQNFAPVRQKTGNGAKCFLIFMLILIIGAGLTVGGIFIGKALNSSDKNSSGETTTSADSDSDKDKNSEYEYADTSETTTEKKTETTTEKKTETTTEQKPESTTEKKTEASTEKTESTTSEEAAGFNPSEENYFIQGTFISADPNLAGGSESTLIFYPNGSFHMDINFGEGFCGYDGTYTTSKKQSEMDDIYVYLTFDSTTNGIPKNATVVFTDTPDYCEFLTDGFGLIGYGEPPYGFYRK